MVNSILAHGLSKLSENSLIGFSVWKTPLPLPLILKAFKKKEKIKQKLEAASRVWAYQSFCLLDWYMMNFSEGQRQEVVTSPWEVQARCGAKTVEGKFVGFVTTNCTSRFLDMIS